VQPTKPMTRANKSVTVTLMIMRHGDAQSHTGSVADAQRPLSAQGCSEVTTTACWLKEYLLQRSQPQVRWLITSPYRRAQETADIIAAHLPPQHLETSTDIIPQGNLDVFIDWLFAKLEQQQWVDGTVVIVSHMPFVSHLVATLDPQTPPLIFPTAGMAELELDITYQRARFLRMIVT